MAADAIQNGAYSFLEKPFEPRRLLTVLRHAAEQHRLADMIKRMREQLVSLSGLDRVLLGSDLRVAEPRWLDCFSGTSGLSDRKWSKCNPDLQE